MSDIISTKSSLKWYERGDLADYPGVQLQLPVWLRRIFLGSFPESFPFTWLSKLTSGKNVQIPFSYEPRTPLKHGWYREEWNSSIAEQLVVMQRNYSLKSIMSGLTSCAWISHCIRLRPTRKSKLVLIEAERFQKELMIFPFFLVRITILDTLKEKNKKKSPGSNAAVIH